MKKKGGNGGMNDDLDHEESDEGVNEGNINFDGNDTLVLKKRGIGINQSNQKSSKLQ